MCHDTAGSLLTLGLDGLSRASRIQRSASGSPARVSSQLRPAMPSQRRNPRRLERTASVSDGSLSAAMRRRHCPEVGELFADPRGSSRNSRSGTRLHGRDVAAALHVRSRDSDCGSGPKGNHGPDQGKWSALGGTRTPNLLIRRRVLGSVAVRVCAFAQVTDVCELLRTLRTHPDCCTNCCTNLRLM
jgi:hypothetical protein